jgi:alpha-amylase
MKYWLTAFNIDGFRCDVAGEVPTDFWDQATAELKKIKPLFMLAEAEKPELMKKSFDMQYGWEAHHIFNGIVKAEKTVKDWDNYMIKIDSILEKDDVYMNFTSNHDENSWNGTEYERLGEAVETFAAMTYAIPGMPLIYNGQEYDLKKRLKFFEKDTIPHTAGKMQAIYEKLGKLKVENIALHGGKNAASYKRIATSDDAKILAFEREKNAKKITFVANLSKLPKQFTTPIEGAFVDYMTGEKVTFTKAQKHNFKPWEYKILILE